MKHLVFVICAFCIVLISGPVWAEELLTLHKAIEIARQNNPQFNMTKMDVEKAKADIIKAKAYPNPDLNLNIGGLPHREGGITEVSREELILGAELSQEIELWGKRSLRKQIAKKNLNQVLSESQMTWLDTKFLVKKVYYILLLKKNLLQIARDNFEIGKRFLGSTQLKFKENKAPYIDVLRAKIEVLNLEQDLIALRQDYEIGKHELNILLGRTPETSFRLKSTLRYRSLPHSLNRLIAIASDNRPEIANAKYSIEKWDSSIKLSKRRIIPNPVLSVWGEKDGPEKNLGGGLGFKIPLWYHQKGEIQSAKSLKNRSQINFNYWKKQIEREVRDAYRRLNKISNTLEVQREGFTASAELIRSSFQAYQQGEESFLKFLETLQTVNKIKNDYYTSLSLWNIQYGRLERAVGSKL